MRKSVLNRDVEAPDASMLQYIGVCRELRGNIFGIQMYDGDGKQALVLCRLPSKFHNKVYVKKGNYVIIQCDGAGSERGEIINVLEDRHIKTLKSMQNVWPAQFESSKDDGGHKDGKRQKDYEGDDSDSDKDKDKDDDLFVNTNRSNGCRSKRKDDGDDDDDE